MTAPDSRDSVELEAGVLADELIGMVTSGIKAATPYIDVRASVARRLQALARGPQQAGGEDGLLAVMDGLVRLANDKGAGIYGLGDKSKQARASVAALQAEVARLTEDCNAIREAHVEAVIALREAGRDAERYRGLRDHDLFDPYNQSDDLSFAFATYTGGVLDSEVDAAINAAKEKSIGR